MILNTFSKQMKWMEDCDIKRTSFKLKIKIYDMTAQQKIYIAGHRGMVGSAIMRTLQQQGHTNFITRTHAELELTNQAAVQHFLNQNDQIKFTWLPLKLEVYMQIIPIQLNLFMTT